MKDLLSMKTEVLIPITPAPQDPEWLVRYKAGKVLDPKMQE